MSDTISPERDSDVLSVRLPAMRGSTRFALIAAMVGALREVYGQDPLDGEYTRDNRVLEVCDELERLQIQNESMREMLGRIDEAARDGLSSWPRIMDRVEFVHECIRLHRMDASTGRARSEESDTNGR